MDDNDSEYKLDADEIEDALTDKTEFYKNRIKIIIASFFIFVADGMSMTLFGFIIMPFSNYFELEENDAVLKVAASSRFMGIMAGSITASLLTKRFGRVLIINCSTLIYFAVSLILGIWISIPLFIICYCLIGFAFGIIVPIFLNILGEYSPDKYRGLILMVAWSFFGIGELISGLIQLAIMPELQKDKLQLFLLVLAIIPFFSVVSSIFLVKDSPKGILLEKKRKENKDLIEEKQTNLDDLNQKQENKEKEENKEETNESKQTNDTYSTIAIIKEMFNKELKKTTILLLFIFVFLGYNAIGIFSISSFFMDYLDSLENTDNKEERSTPARDIIINSILYGVADCGSNFVGGVFGEIRKFGRKGGIIIFAFLAAFFTILGLFKKILFQISSPIISGCTNIYVNLVMDYVVELYPTKIRDTSTSLLFFVYRISCFLSNYISLGFYDVNKFIPYIIYSVYAILSIIFTWLLPYEMAGKTLK